ncbi:glucose 1-dehydrogenase [Nocardia sp. NBC_00508]|uniref:SDR family NAD(P)-dependent oxidoreductase n=1 Tax=Nocardia sp. NBC_00508 TaxID=2975992 RepID=UPI002E8227E5|nr:glucose 1-dehydrogenase [Nocardia sp. NBC_00508]WUD65856.1 glucose 1-dehydrogenase [Nocardia sp. NBC_00508]
MSVKNPFRIDGQTAFVTGASRGIGRAIAVGLAEAGADVAVLARDAGQLDKVATEIEHTGRRALTCVCDVSDASSVAVAVDRVFDEFGTLDIVVNNVGGVEHVGPFLDLQDDDWQQVMATTLGSVVNVCRAVGPRLIEQGGTVINVASMAGTAGMPMLAPYAAAKAGVISLTRTLAAEWARAGVRVNALAPGWISTDLTRTFVDNARVSDGLMMAVPQGRWGEPSDIAGAAIYLASDSARLITGACLMMDGGTTCFVGGPAMIDLLDLGRIPV